MIESFVDLTYRGLALGRRIKLTEVRPSTAFVELATPMPVGTQVAIVTDEGLTLGAVVTWIHEQVAGSDRTPGMVVAPALAAEPAAAWWKARVALPEDDQPRPRPSRARSVSVRPRPNTDRLRSTTDRTAVVEPPITEESPTAIAPPPTAGAATGDDGPTIIADLEARVLAAAGLDVPRSTNVHERPTVAMSAIDGSALELESATDPNERPTMAMRPVEQTRLMQAAQRTRELPVIDDGKATMSTAGEHEVIDDGKATMIMDAIDPATLGIDLPPGADASFTGIAAITDEPSAPVITIEPGDEDGEGEPDDGEAAPGAGASEPGTDKPPASRSLKRRRKRR